jgi:hypothetical protein
MMVLRGMETLDGEVRGIMFATGGGKGAAEEKEPGQGRWAERFIHFPAELFRIACRRSDRRDRIVRSVAPAS